MKRTLSILLFLLCLISFALPFSAETADKSELEPFLNEVFDPTLYTEETYQNYQKAINTALAVYENDYAADESIKTALTALKEAKSKLVLRLDRNALLDYISDLEEYLYGTEYDLTDETAAVLNNTKKEFATLYEKELLTKEQLTSAKESFEKVKKLAEESKKIKKFSSKDAAEDVVVPEKVISSAQGLGKVTAIRLTILGIGLGFIVLGTIAAILYFKPPKFLQ